MLGLGSFPAADVTTFQMFKEESVQGRGDHCRRSVSPWTQQSTECCQNYQLPVDSSSRLQTDQFTPQEYPIVTKLPPRQLQWVTSHTHGYNVAATALSYDVEAVQSGRHHLGQLHQIAVSTSNIGWSPQFNQPATQNLITAATDCPGSNLLLQAFPDPTKHYFLDCPLEQVNSMMMQSACGSGQFTNTSSAVSAFTPGQPQLVNCAQPSNVYRGSEVKSDPDGSSDWKCTLPIVWPKQEVCSKSSPGQQVICTSTTSHLPYPSTMPYTPLPAQIAPWSTTCEQKPMKITPSMSIGERTNSKLARRNVYTVKFVNSCMSSNFTCSIYC